MDEWITRVWKEIVARPEGPLALRFYLQPCMSAFFALKDGLKDARNGKPAYFWALFTNPSERKELARDGWKSVGKIFVLAAVLDIVYQLIVLHMIRPLETLIIATLLALVPYLALRGPVNRIATAAKRKHPAPPRRRAG